MELGGELIRCQTDVLIDDKSGEVRNVDLVYVRYRIIKITGQTVTVRVGGHGKKLIRLSARKRFAYATEQEALIAFVARNKRYIEILRRHLDVAETARRKVADLLSSSQEKAA